MENKITEKEYSQFVGSIAKPGEDIIRDLTPEKAHLWHMSSAGMGEMGELFDACKKYAIYGKPLDRENAIEELGDAEFFLQAIRDVLGVTRDEVLSGNINKLKKRYASGYSNQAAQQRADKTE